MPFSFFRHIYDLNLHDHCCSNGDNDFANVALFVTNTKSHYSTDLRSQHSELTYLVTLQVVLFSHLFLFCSDRF